ncbi:polyprenyl synthetase family protein [Bacteroidales bacterium OttesenSCG-928-B11]|nr:polyprenyl synthetase family protein [Bacteroidales bacterium OttesenSCG-928-B11]MDL2325471.1 polyprenyl synthetase family protein [Bacteroidales bacterium OttesenSCG-928-A14]
MNLEDIFLASTHGKEPKQLYQPIEYVIMQPGKRVRPRLVQLSAELFDGDPTCALYIGAAFEMLHNFTLIHDDIMDKAPIRRGKETVYKKWNSNIAILSGDALANMALQQILNADMECEARFKVIDIFIKTSLEVCEGQQYDLNFETSDHVTIEEYLKMIRLKTAVMLAGCLKAGAILSGASAEDQETIYKFGIDLGIAFQLKDDLLDLYADHEVFGKKKGMDIQDNKKTYLYLQALEDASPEQHKELKTLFASDSGNFNEKLSRVMAIYESLRIKEKIEAVADGYIENALSTLEAINLPSSKKENLKEMTLQLCKRTK